MNDMLKNGTRTWLALAPLLLGGCAAGSYCAGPQDYQEAQSVAPIQPADGLQIKESSSALKIPPPPANAVAYGEYADPKNEEGLRCLDQPPKLELPEPKPDSDAPAPPATPAEAPPAQPG